MPVATGTQVAPAPPGTPTPPPSVHPTPESTQTPEPRTTELTATPVPALTSTLATNAEHRNAMEECDRALVLDTTTGVEWSHRPQRILGPDQYSRSIESCGRVIELNPGNAQAYISRGYAYVRTDQDLRAIEDFDSAIELDPGNAVFYARRGYGYAELEQFLRAVEDYNLAIELDPENAVFYHRRGYAYTGLGENRLAIEDHDRAIGLDRDNTMAYGNRGVAYAQLGQYHLAIRDFESAVRLDPGNAQFYAGRGSVYDELGEYQLAIADFESAIRLDPGNAQFYVGRGIVYDKHGEYQLAIADYDKAIELDPDLGLPSFLGLYRKGSTLHFSVVSLERTQELRYSTIDPLGVVRRWSLSPSAEGMELVLVRAKVENHTAVRAVINVDRTAAELRDFTNVAYLPLPIAETVWQDFRGEDEALVRMDLGQCFDGTRALIDVGATVRWRSEAEKYQYIAFEDTGIAVGPGGRVDIAPGAALTHTFGEAGPYPYVCGDSEGIEWPAEIYAATPEGKANYVERATQFIQGSFELLQGHGLDGFLVFEAPVGVEFREMRWRAGDSITFRF